MLVHHVCGLQSGLDHAGHQYGRAACACHRTVDKVYRVVGGGDGTGVGVEYHTVACSDHTDAVANDGFRGVGGGGDGAYHAKGSHFGEGKTRITGLCLLNDVLGAGGLVGHQRVLGDLVIDAAHLGLCHAKGGHNGGFLACKLADGGDHLFALSHGHSAHGTVAGVCLFNGFFHRFVYTDQASALILGGIPLLCGRRGGSRLFKFGYDARYDLVYLRLRQIHSH